MLANCRHVPRLDVPLRALCPLTYTLPRRRCLLRAAPGVRSAALMKGSQTPGKANLPAVGPHHGPGPGDDKPPFIKHVPRPRHGAKCSYTRLPLLDSHTNTMGLGRVPSFNK